MIHQLSHHLKEILFYFYLTNISYSPLEKYLVTLEYNNHRFYCIVVLRESIESILFFKKMLQREIVGAFQFENKLKSVSFIFYQKDNP